SGAHPSAERVEAHPSTFQLANLLSARSADIGHCSERRSLMSTQVPEDPRPLPSQPNLRHLKDQAKDLLKAGEAESLAAAQFEVARRYGFASWPKLKAHIE